MQKERNPAPDFGLGTTVLAGMGATVVGAILFLLISWSGSHVAEKSGATTTVSYSTRPVARSIRP